MTAGKILVLFRRSPVGVIAAALSVILGILIYFRGDALSIAEQELKEKTSQGKRYTANLANAAHLQEHYDALVMGNKDREARLARGNQLTQNLQYFYKLEADTGVQMSANQVTQPQSATAMTNKSLVPVAFAISVQGDFDSVIDFLRRLEQGLYFSRVLTCTMNASGVAGVDTGKSRNISLALNVELLGMP